MSMFFTRDAWDEARDERIAEIGLAAYEKEVKEANEKYDRENPDYVSKTEPFVRRGDVIATWKEVEDGSVKSKVFEKDFHITRITKDGHILGTLITNNPMEDKYMGAVHEWEYGQYKRLASVTEYDTSISTVDKINLYE